MTCYFENVMIVSFWMEWSTHPYILDNFRRGLHPHAEVGAKTGLAASHTNSYDQNS
jgi:hypothetical protein